jgi:hypothetical protein
MRAGMTIASWEERTGSSLTPINGKRVNEKGLRLEPHDYREGGFMIKPAVDLIAG